jgi:hypothetical protein
MTINTTGQTKQLAADNDLLSGLQANQSKLPSMTIEGANVTAATAIATVQKRVDAGNAFVAAKGGYLQASQANKATLSATAEFVQDLKTALRLAYKDDSATLAQFGLVPRKKTAPKTVAEKVVAVAKGLSTRAERNTMGARAKAKVKGTVPATLTVDVSAGELVGTSGAQAGPTGPTSPVAPVATGSQKQ